MAKKKEVGAAEFRIVSGWGGGEKEETVSGLFVSKYFGVWRPVPSLYIVTHLRTGCQVGSAKTLAKAKDAIKHLEAKGAFWNRGEFGGPDHAAFIPEDRAWLDEAREACQFVGIHT